MKSINSVVRISPPRHPSLTGFVVGLSAGIAAFASASIERPNILFIISDDAGFTDFGFQSPVTGEESAVPTPHLDALAKRGVHFTNSYAAAVCSPSRAALVTGSYQNRVGYEFNIDNSTDGSREWDGLREEVPTIFKRMRDLGYITGVIGKWHLGAIHDEVSGGTVTRPGNRPPRQGVDEFFGILSGSRRYNVGDIRGIDTLREMSLDANGLEVDKILESTPPWNTTYRYITHAFGQGAIDFIARHHDADAPFFLYVSFTAPHGPISASPDFDDPRLAHLSGERREYASMLLTMDKEIGRILNRLEDPLGNGTAPSIADNTFVVFVNDNGGARPIPALNRPLRDFKGSVWEGGIRVPMLMAGAGVSDSAVGSRYPHPVHLIDLAPTFIAAGGGIPPDDFDGRDLLPFVNGMADGAPHSEIVIRFEAKAGIRSDNWKLVRAGESAPFRLYDLTTDFSETNDLAGDHPEIVARMLVRLTDREATFDKPRHRRGAGADAGQSISLNDRFVLNPPEAGLLVDAAPDGDGFVRIDDAVLERGASDGNGALSHIAWSDAEVWIDPGTLRLATMHPRDAFAGCVLEFPVANDFSYRATNDMTRATSLEFMLNCIVLSGDFTGPRPRTAEIDGLPLLFTRDLDGNAPRIEVEAGGRDFSYTFANEIILYDDLSITGDGDTPLTLTGGVRDFETPRDLTFSGSSRIFVSKDLGHRGTTRVAAGSLTLLDGMVITNSPEVIVERGAILAGDGRIEGLLIGEGTIAPGRSIGTLSAVAATLRGRLEIEIEGTGCDLLKIDGLLDIDGATLALGILDGKKTGDAYPLVRYEELTGAFAEVAGLPEGYTVDYAYGPSQDQIAIRPRTPLEARLE